MPKYQLLIATFSTCGRLSSSVVYYVVPLRYHQSYSLQTFQFLYILYLGLFNAYGKDFSRVKAE